MCHDKLLECGKVVWAEKASVKETDKLPQVLRRATLQDHTLNNENILFARAAWRRCQDQIKELKLNMRLLKVRYTLDRSVVKITYTSEERVDFRKFVQSLALELHARIEMRQLGARSVAAMLDGYAPCGRRLCCASWLNEIDNVTMRMAKQQGLALNPATLNGMCDKLKCCLRYEQAWYKEQKALMPRVNDKVQCREGKGRVVEVNPLTNSVKLVLEDNRLIQLDASLVKSTGGGSAS